MGKFELMILYVLTTMVTRNGHFYVLYKLSYIIMLRLLLCVCVCVYLCIQYALGCHTVALFEWKTCDILFSRVCVCVCVWLRVFEFVYKSHPPMPESASSNQRFIDSSLIWSYVYQSVQAIEKFNKHWINGWMDMRQTLSTNTNIIISYMINAIFIHLERVYRKEYSH